LLLFNVIYETKEEIAGQGRNVFFTEDQSLIRKRAIVVHFVVTVFLLTQRRKTPKKKVAPEKKKSRALRVRKCSAKGNKCTSLI